MWVNHFIICSIDILYTADIYFISHNTEIITTVLSKLRRIAVILKLHKAP